MHKDLHSMYIFLSSMIIVIIVSDGQTTSNEPAFLCLSFGFYVQAHTRICKYFSCFFLCFISFCSIFSDCPLECELLSFVFQKKKTDRNIIRVGHLYFYLCLKKNSIGKVPHFNIQGFEWKRTWKVCTCKQNDVNTNSSPTSNNDNTTRPTWI